MSYMRCCVPGCSGTITTDSQHSLHIFPNPVKDSERFRTWIFKIGGEILQLSNEYIYKNRRVCHRHFEERYCCRFNRISNIAIPTVNMPGLSTQLHFTNSEKEQPLREIILPAGGSQLATEGLSTQLHFTNSEKEQPLREIILPAGGSQLATEGSSTQMHCINSEEQQPLREISLPLVSKVNAARKTVKNVSKCIRKMKMNEVERNLYNKLVIAKRKLSKLKIINKKQSQELKIAKNIFSNRAFVKVMEEMPKSAKVLTLLQMREHAKQEKGRRFHIKEKIIALTILKQSPKAYKFLRKILVLPSPQTLIKLLAKANVQPGINKNIFDQLQEKATKMSTNEKLCILLYDEMSLQANVTYNERKDRVAGFVTNGSETQQILANHAQVFMVRGLIKNYKEPISYTFSSGATKGPELAKQIKEIITELQKTGFKVLATVCDQGTNNRQAIKILVNETRGIYLRRGETPKNNAFLLNGEEIVPLYDPPHLLKGIRNNLLSKNLEFEMEGKKKIAKWHHLELFHAENPGYKGIRLVPKLTDAHIIPQKIGKMKVKYASQVFSATVASNMGYLADKGILPNECKDTADLLMFVDKLFDSVYGSYSKSNRYAKPLLGPVTPKSCHHNTWKEARKIIKTMLFVGTSGKKEIVPTLNNWVWTIEGIEVLLKKLAADYNITSVWLRHLNQDPIENFFGAIRSHGCRNTNPTPDRFESAYTTLLVNSLTSVHAPGGNCEQDLGETLLTLVSDESCEPDHEKLNKKTEWDIGAMLDIELEIIENKKRDPKVFAPLQYISGYFIHKAKKIFKNCQNCKANLIGVEEIEYLRYREYAGRRWLCTPSESVIRIISNLQDVAIAILKKDLEKNNLKLYIKIVMEVLVDLNLTCQIHKGKLKEFLYDKVTRFFIFTYCKNINRILYGKKSVDDMQDKFENIAKN